MFAAFESGASSGTPAAMDPTSQSISVCCRSRSAVNHTAATLGDP
jgi:hypothetical protein